MENFQPDTFQTLLSTEQLLTILQSYVENKGCSVQFTGGEPLLNPKIYYLIQEVKKMGAIPEVNTNGIALSEKVASRLKQSGLDLVKVSVPAFEKALYREITSVDALDKVLHNIHQAKEILDVRVNVVATKKIMQNLEDILECAQRYGIKQLLFLEYLYYPHVGTSSDFFDNYVNIEEEYGSFLRTYFKHYERYPSSNCFEWIDSYYNHKNEFTVYIKQSYSVMRIPDCYKCKKFCQEGVYELRLSTGGYLNFCNTPNKFGADCSALAKKNIDEIFRNFTQILSSADRCPNTDFRIRLKELMRQ